MSEAAAVTPLDPTDIAGIHDVLSSQFTARYLRKSHFNLLARPISYDPDNELCNYDRTWWPAEPNEHSERLGSFVLGVMHRSYYSREQMDNLFIPRFAERAPALMTALKSDPVMLANDHDPDMQAAVAHFQASRALAAEMPGDYDRNLIDMFKISHNIGTKAFALIRLRGLPLTFVGLARHVVGPHFTLPNNRQMRESAIPVEFRSAYNDRAVEDCVTSAQSDTDHPDGLHSWWSIAASGTRSYAGEGEHEGKRIIYKVSQGTGRLGHRMGASIQPVYTALSKGKGRSHVELGTMIRAEDVTDDTLDTIAADQAEFRRRHGQPNVYYAGELAA